MTETTKPKRAHAAGRAPSIHTPRLAFNCRLVYLTPAGHRKHSSHKTRAIAADIALEIAERQLRADKRRRVASVVYGEAIQQ